MDKKSTLVAEEPVDNPATESEKEGNKCTND
eukprot:CAMPEP_0204834610 /NCGR_PEP_ID=MMETSP1346-20131115/20181_1 /ASSEMBLY_ACC=CAM_ASM_000771 /TAXON_ID=215587 /ORGANISM="Aplanochytrium stocchinoi, Strain GSBS06" /LENGTH=30 /DNA_ID= /DNA_START= /DNA_END= /DNA_ORIENTATION=